MQFLSLMNSAKLSFDRRIPMLSPNKCMLKALVVSAVLFAANSAFAGTGSVATMDDPTHIMSLTFSPIHLANPVVEITAEFKAHEQWGLALVGGAGQVTAKDDILGDVDFSVWEVGGQLRYYVLGDFDHGMQIGGEILYVNVSNDEIDTSEGRFSGTGEGLGVGPFLGYKLATGVGFTFDAQLGIQRTFLQAEAEHTASGTSAEEEDRDWGPIVNLNVGWSF